MASSHRGPRSSDLSGAVKLLIKVGPGASGTRATGRERDTFFLWAKLLPPSSRALRETVGSTGGVPSSHRAFGQSCPRGSGRLSPWPAGHPGDHLLSARQRAASSGVRFPEATDLLGALRLSGYACGARVMAAVRGAAAKTKRSMRTAAAPRSDVFPPSVILLRLVLIHPTERWAGHTLPPLSRTNPGAWVYRRLDVCA